VLVGGLSYSLINFASAPRLNVKVGVFYYPWYKQGYGNYQWNGSAGSPYPRQWNVVDRPTLGYYSSMNETVIRKQLDWFKYAGIDFGVISWWGMTSYENDVTKEIFNVTNSYAPWFRWVIMVEGYNETEGGYNFSELFEYINSTYYSKYPNLFLYIDDKPLLCFFNALNMTGTKENPKVENLMQIHSSSLFEARIIGQNPSLINGTAFVDWYGWVPSPPDETNPPKLNVSMDGMIIIEPRYDNTYLGNFSNTPYKADPSYNQSLYANEWNQVLNYARNGQVNYVLIYSWNEYHERSQIEPCFDKTSAHANNPYYLLNQTKEYVADLKAIPEFPLDLVLPLALAIAVVLAVAVYKRKILK
jgi:hypothetical protein